ncbi:hypothetical protein JRO89_XS12G0173300 [Xanthoceras sorbifolium]|uniref:Stress-induced protein KIN2-like n=1 Tax=Xanthoceras sorbifolium TaxID=99658 RepID=A0ABQ8HCW9_9ROSI|nr:hypothetical protein JRO89_XS12G0173300 [Xanthoceras sorbifolium]
MNDRRIQQHPWSEGRNTQLQPFAGSTVLIQIIIPKMNQSQNASFQAGQAKGQTQEKANQMMDKAGDVMQSAKESCQEAGQQMKAKAQGAADAVKDTLGNK